MKLLLLSGNFPKGEEDLIVKNSKSVVQFAANTLQWNIIKGLNNSLEKDLYVLSAPFVNSYPKGYRKMFYNGKRINDNETYISFNNIFGLRNVSRFKKLKKESKYFLKLKDKEKYIVVYSPHVPLLKTACFLKKKDPSITIVLMLPDLPQFVALNNNISFLYKLLKPFDIKSFYKYSKKFDKYILLTEQMNDIVNLERKPNIVIEGIVDKAIKVKKHKSDKKIITYTGTLDKKYGICNLIDAFMLIDKDNYELKICGRGDSEDYIINCSKKDKRIKYVGQLSYNDSKKIQEESTVLVNPRQNIETFTKYSFPSKNLEYLNTGIPVVAYKLDGIPSEYDGVFFYPKNNSIEMLKEEIVKCAEMNSKDVFEYGLKTQKFLESKTIDCTIKRMLAFIKEGEKI